MNTYPSMPRWLATLLLGLGATLVAACGASSPGTHANARQEGAEPVESSASRIEVVDASDAVPSTLTPGTRYAVTYRQQLAKWRVTQGFGRAKVWRAEDPSCATHAIPNGFWIVTRDERGEPELLAPSHTELPAGFPDRVALKACGEGDLHAVHAPQAVIDLLAADAGLVYVDD